MTDKSDYWWILELASNWQEASVGNMGASGIFTLKRMIFSFSLMNITHTNNNATQFALKAATIACL